MSSIKVLLIEDDERLAQLTARYLESHGVLVTISATGPDGQVEALRRQYDCIVLDVMLPGRDGIEVTRELRARTDVPIVMVTARTEEADRVLGLEVGADDYVTKPFSPRELVLRVRSVLRRAVPVSEPALLHDGDLTADTGRRIARLGDRALALTVREFDLLVFLLRNPARAWSRADLLDQVWGWQFGDQSTVTVHVRRLREKVETEPSRPTRLVTVFGVGYRWDPAS